jgi:hypothetical protein
MSTLKISWLTRKKFEGTRAIGAMKTVTILTLFITMTDFLLHFPSSTNSIISNYFCKKSMNECISFKGMINIQNMHNLISVILLLLSLNVCIVIIYLSVIMIEKFIFIKSRVKFRLLCFLHVKR